MSLKKYNLERIRVAAAAVVILFLFLSTAAVVSAATTSTTVSTAVGPVISLLTTNGTVNVNVTPTGSGAQTMASDTVTVSTNDTAGYTLQLAETGSSTSLVSGGNSIAASSGSQTTPIVMIDNSWGYRVDSLGGFGAGPTFSQNSITPDALKFAAVPATGSPNTLKTTSGTAANDTTTVWYGVVADTTVPFGTYTNSVTYTATAN